MTRRKQKLELTWIGKENRPRLAPGWSSRTRNAPARPQRGTENDLFDNILIHGDNLLALKVLEQEEAGKVSCIHSFPPYSTRSAFAESSPRPNVPATATCRRT